MADWVPPGVGQIGWVDITVDDAGGLRAFYEKVMGWSPFAAEVEGYEDWTMMSGDGQPVVGICHRRGPNTGIPGGWLLYFMVEDLEVAVGTTVEGGGEVVERRDGFAILRDPSGAAFALMSPPPDER